VILDPHTATILYVKIGKQLNTFFSHDGGGGKGQTGLLEGVKQGVLVGVVEGVGDKHGLLLVPDGVGVGVGVVKVDAVGVGVGKLLQEQSVAAKPS
jgi:hypothetical protein